MLILVDSKRDCGDVLPALRVMEVRAVDDEPHRVAQRGLNLRQASSSITAQPRSPEHFPRALPSRPCSAPPPLRLIIAHGVDAEVKVAPAAVACVLNAHRSAVHGPREPAMLPVSVQRQALRRSICGNLNRRGENRKNRPPLRLSSCMSRRPRQLGVRREPLKFPLNSWSFGLNAPCFWWHRPTIGQATIAL